MSRLFPALFLLALGALVAPARGDGFEEDLAYAGRTLRDWITDVRAKDPAKAHRASRTLRLVGPEARDAAPALLLALKCDDQTDRDRVAQTLARLGPEQVPLLTAGLGLEDDRVAYGAARALGWLGRDARPAMRALQRQLRSPSPMVRASSAIALWQIGRDTAGLEVLRKDLASTNGDQLWAAWALPTFGPSAAPLAGELVALLASKDDRERQFAFDAFRSIGKAGVPALVRGLVAANPRQRLESAEALGRLGPGIEDAIQPLLVLLQDRASGPRVAAVRALGRMGIVTPEVVDALRKALRDGDDDVREESARAVGALRIDVASADLRRVALDPSLPVSRAAVEAMGRLSKPAMSDLVFLLKQDDGLLRRHALQALAGIGPDAAEAVGPIAGLAADPASGLNVAAVETLAAIGEAAAPALAASLRGTKEVRHAAGQAFTRVIPPREALPGLLRLYEEEVASRPHVLSALRLLRPPPREVLPLLRSALGDDRPGIQPLAIDLAGDLGEDARPLLPAIARLVGHHDTEVSRRADTWMRKMGEGKALVEPPVIVSSIEAPARLLDRLVDVTLQEDLYLDEIRDGLRLKLGLMPVPPAWLFQDADIGRLAGRAIAALGRDTLPALEAAVGEAADVLREDSLADVARAGPSMVPTACEYLRDRLLSRRLAAAQALRRLGPRAKEAVPDLRKAIHDSNRFVAVESARALHAVAGERESVLPVLIAALDGIGTLPMLAARGLSEMGPRAGRAPALYAALRHPKEAVRREATIALAAIAPPGERANFQLRECMPDPAWSVRVEQVRALAQLDPEFDPAPMLIEVLRRSTDSNTRQRTLFTFEELAPAGRAAIPYIRRQLVDESFAVRVAAARALIALGEESHWPRQVLATVVDSPQPRLAVRQAAQEKLPTRPNR